MADRSRMNREAHVRICEGLGVKFPRATRLHNERAAALAALHAFNFELNRYFLNLFLTLTRLINP